MKIVFSLFLMFFVFQTSTAAEQRPVLDKKTTEFGYDPNNFCAVNAKNRIEDLDKLTKSELEKARPLTLELNELKAKKVLIKGFLNLRDEFISSINQIKNNYSKDELKNVGALRSLLRSSMTLEAAKMAIAEKPEAELKVEKLCEENSTALCKYLRQIHIRTMYSEEIEGIDKTLNNFAEARSKIKNSQFPEDEINAIYATIPKTINPSAILETVMSKGPDVGALLRGSKETIASCLNGKNEDCVSLMRDHDQRSNLSKLFSGQLDDIHKDFSAREFKSIMLSADNLAIQQNSEIDEQFQKQMGSALKKLEDKKSDGQKLGLSQQNINDLISACKDSKKESQEKCKDLSTEIVNFFDAKTKEIDDSIAKKTEELNAVITSTGSLGKIMKMRQFVAQKYLRKCSNAKFSDVSINNNICSKLQEIANTTSEDVEQLNSNVGGVVSRLLAENTHSKKRGALGTFSKDELAVYNNYCKNTILSESMQDICREIDEEYSAIKDQKELKDWEEFHKKYLVVQNDKSAKGYDVYYKKSNARIFGEGLSQSVGLIYPMWLNNFTLSYQIETLESQALFMKQLNYMNSPTSPWASYTYFPGSYYTFPSGTNFANPFTTSAGFNFTN